MSIISEPSCVEDAGHEEQHAREIVTTNLPALEKLANFSQEKEVISREEMLALIGSDTKQSRKKPA